MTPRRTLLAGACLGVALLGAAFLPARVRRLGGGSDEVPVLTVAHGRFVRRVPAEGNLGATRATPISVPASAEGPLRVAWLAPEGSRVAAGDVVVRFDPTDMEKALRDAKDDLRTADLKTGKERAASAAEIKKLTADEELARGELAGASRFQKKDATIFSRSEIIESEVDQDLARQRAEHAKDARRIHETVGRADLAILDIQSGQARYKIEQAEHGLAALTVIAPHAGVLVYQTDWRGNPVRVGDTVWNGEPLAEIPDLQRMQAEVFVLEADAGGLAVGRPAEVELESAPGIVYAARVSRVDALAKPRLRGSPVQYFAVTLELARTEPARMKPGARVRATLTLDDLADAVSVPRQAVFERDAKNVVYRRDAGGAFEPVAVELGASAPGRVVIAKGLAAGDVVALADPTRPAAPPAGAPAAKTEAGTGAGSSTAAGPP